MRNLAVDHEGYLTAKYTAFPQFFFSSRRRHTRFDCDWSSDVCSSDLIHSALGTLEDFRRLVAAARDHGLEIALDFAIQCSPDHPWLREHPEWFRHRPDGKIGRASCRERV